MDKIHCSGCGRDLDSDTFAWRNKERAVRQSRCKECQSKNSKGHYQNNKQDYKSRAKEHDQKVIIENKQRMYEYLSHHPCIDCGERDIRYLQFDHVRGVKVNEVASMLQMATSWATIEKEMAKCEVRCANCHRIKTGERGGFWRNILSF